jgi:DNA-binding CsgD family transcriptional regulator
VFRCSEAAITIADMSAYARQRGVERITELAGQGRDLLTFWREATEALKPAVPHYFAPCFFTMDPATLLVTSHFDEGIPEIPPDWLAAEYYEDDFNKMADVARSEAGVSTLHEATGGDPTRSAHYHTGMKEYGAEQEVVCVLRTASGEVWGSLGLYRDASLPMFSAEELEFLRAISAPLAEGARRGLLIGEAVEPDAPMSPGLVVLRDDWTVESLTPGVERWLDDLDRGAWTAAGKLPSSVMAVAGQALRTSVDAESPGEIAFARVLSDSGQWVVLHGATMVSAGPRRVAVIVEPAQPARIAPLLMSAYGLTEREQELTRLVLQGDSTVQIAERLVVSPHTVQEHLKSIFEKTGVRSRRDLVGKVFFAHYEPRLRDNERRTADGKPMRGGPVA